MNNFPLVDPIVWPHGFKRWESFEQVQAAEGLLGEEWVGQTSFERKIVDSRWTSVHGFCANCHARARFSIRSAQHELPNWRETLECESCGLINRWRASLHFFRLLPRVEGPVYLTEQSTSLFERLRETVVDLIGSEFLGPGVIPGEERNWNGTTLRHEDITRLSFADASIATVLSFDVLEHVPDYVTACREFARVLKTQGLLILTAPFSIQAEHTTIRARQAEDGSIEHLLPAIYHGDPLSADGVLCYQEFGWDLLAILRSVGFSSAEVVTCWSPAFGYLGSAQPFIVARR